MYLVQIEIKIAKISSLFFYFLFQTVEALINFFSYFLNPRKKVTYTGK